MFSRLTRTNGCKLERAKRPNESEQFDECYHYVRRKNIFLLLASDVLVEQKSIQGVNECISASLQYF